MSNASFTNRPDLDTALLSARMTQRYDVHDEATFLQQQAADAKIAMRQTLDAMQETAQPLVNVRAWAQAYPWYTVGAAAVAGFISATMVFPSRHRQNHNSQTASAAESRLSFSSSLLSLLFGMGRGMLMSFLATALNPTLQYTTSEDGTRGVEDASVTE